MGRPIRPFHGFSLRGLGGRMSSALPSIRAFTGGGSVFTGKSSRMLGRMWSNRCRVCYEQGSEE